MAMSDGRSSGTSPFELTTQMLECGIDMGTSEPGLEMEKKQSSGATRGGRKRARPQGIKLPSPGRRDGTSALTTPVLSSASWSRPDFSQAILTPNDSPEGLHNTLWDVCREGSIASSTSSTESLREKFTTLSRNRQLERPLIGRPKDSKERCMSVSLIVGRDGVAQVLSEEVEVEFLEVQKDCKIDNSAIMRRMVSSAGSDTSVSRHLNNLCLVNSTRGEVLVRSASQQTDISHSLPLTPGHEPAHKYVSPKQLKKGSETMSRTLSMLNTPESERWVDSDNEDDDYNFEADEMRDFSEVPATDDAQIAVKRLFDRKQGKFPVGFVGNSMPLSPVAVPRIANSSTTCGACQIVCRSRAALAVHTAKCSVKQTPFASADYFGSFDIFNMSEDAIFMSSFTHEADLPSRMPQSCSLLEPAFLDDHPATMETHDDLLLGMSPRKKTRLISSRPAISTRSMSTPIVPLFGR